MDSLSTLSSVNENLRQTLTIGGNQQNSVIEVFANSTGSFDSFYGKNYNNIDVRFKTSQTSGSGATYAAIPELRWLTTNSGEDVTWTTTETDPWGERFRRTPSTIPSTFDGKYRRIRFNMTGKSDWEDRIVSALRIDLFSATDEDETAIIETDIDYIKIYANTSGDAGTF